jgi:hypothetical protein
VDQLIRDLTEKGLGGVEVGGEGPEVRGRIIRALMYADDIVLLADSAEELQEMIDEVQEYCTKWRMKLNTKKSQVMVFNSGEERCKECDGGVPLPVNPLDDDYDNKHPCCRRWRYGQSYLPVVHKYKYLGVWFTSDLTWTLHHGETLRKVTGRSNTLHTFLANNRILVRAKTMVWLAQARPLLEYGGETWRYTKEQWKAIEREQTKAGIKIRKLNKKTNAKAIRGLMRVPTIQGRVQAARLKYLVRMLTMDGATRLVRYVVHDLTPVATGATRPCRETWMCGTTAVLEADDGLRTAYGKIKGSLERNYNLLPEKEDVTAPDDRVYEPVKRWRSSVKWWMNKQSLDQTRGWWQDRETDKSLSLLRRAAEGSDVAPVVGVTRVPNTGENQIRLRLLSGTSSLHHTLHHYTDRTEVCPGNCGEAETATHFLLHCSLGKAARDEFEGAIRLCRGEDDHYMGVEYEGPKNCKDYYDTMAGHLDDDGQALFLLGGPVRRRGAAEEEAAWRPCKTTETAARAMVRAAWKARSEVLQVTVGRANEVDLTKSGTCRNRPLTLFFPNHKGTLSQHNTARA